MPVNCKTSQFIELTSQLTAIGKDLKKPICSWKLTKVSDSIIFKQLPILCLYQMLLVATADDFPFETIRMFINTI